VSGGNKCLRPWTVTASRMTFADRWLRVRSDDCLTAEGVEISPYHVIETSDWSCVVALTKELHLVLVREYRHARGIVIDGLPGGIIEAFDASPEEGARRELSEETGYGGGRCVLVLTTYPDPANFTNKAVGFLALDVEPIGAQALDVAESIEIVLADFPDVLTRLASGELRMHAVHTATLWSAAARILLGDVPGAEALRDRLRPVFAKP
jgi:8-oxo-dGTP pyrophosphatase MutT (NUDIX family)